MSVAAEYRETLREAATEWRMVPPEMRKALQRELWDLEDQAKDNGASEFSEACRVAREFLELAGGR